MATKRTKASKAPFGNHAPDWEPTGSSATAISADVRTGDISEELVELGKERAAQPSKRDMTDAFGEPVPETDATGAETSKVRWSIDMRDRRKRAVYRELTDPRRRLMKDRSGRLNARPKARLVNRESGEATYVLVEHEDRIGRKGNMRPSVHYRGCRVLAGPGGMLFREWKADCWEPIGRKCLGTPIDGSDPCALEPVQIAPDGTLWRLMNGEWRVFDRAS